MKISEIKKQSLQSLQGKWGLVVLLTFIMFSMYYILPSIVEIILSGGFSEWIDQEGTTATENIVEMIFTILLFPFSIGVCWFYLSLVRDNNPKISNVFAIYSDGKTSIKVIGATILQGIFVFLWSLLLIIPGIIKSISYSQTFYILRDHPEYTILEAITESRKKMVGYKWKYFLLGLSFIGWGILCLFTVGIGLLWLIPYYSTAIATFYKEVIYSQDADSSETV